MKKTKSKVMFITTKTLFILFIISSLSVSAQKTDYELSIVGGSGFSFLNIQPKIPKASSSGFSGDIGIGYTLFPTEQFGISLGAGLGMSGINCKIPKTWDIEIDNIEFTFSDYSESVKMTFLNIPFMLQYQDIHKSNPQKPVFYAMGGVKVIVINSKFETKLNVSNLNKRLNHKGNISNAFINSLTFEAGIKKHYIYDNLILYTGVYFDYGLNNFLEEYRHSPEESLTGLLIFSDKLNLITTGIKLRLVFSFRHTKPSAINICPGMRKN